MSEKLWYWRREGTVYGPVDEEAFEARIETGRVGRGDPVRAGTSGPWQRLEACPRWELSLEDAEAQGIRPRRSGIQKLHLVVVTAVILAIAAGSWAMWGGEQTSSSEQPPLVIADAPLPEPPPLIEVPPRPVSAPIAPPRQRKRKQRRKRREIVIGSDTAPKDGGLSGAAIAKGFRRGLPRIQACAKRYATGGGQIPTKMAVSYSIRNSGSVTEAKVRPHEISQTPLGRCIVGVLRRLQYPSYRGEARTVSFPLAFNQK